MFVFANKIWQICRNSSKNQGNKKMKNQNQKSHKSLIVREFTLIELLITISIIAILAAMLLPVLNKARNKARSAECISKFKQVGLSMQMYIEDNQDYYPQWRTGYASTDFGAHHNVYFPDLLLPYINPNAKIFGAKGYLWKGSPFTCLTVLEDCQFPIPNRYGNYFTMAGTIGGWFKRYAEDHPDGQRYRERAPSYPRKTNEHRNPSSTVLSCDSRIDAVGSWVGYTMATSTSRAGAVYWYGNRIYPVHSGGLNWLFADGHVKWKKWDLTDSMYEDAEFSRDWELQH